MPFNSILFLLFLLVVVVLYNTMPKRGRRLLLLVCGYVFYAFNGYLYLLYLLLVTGLSYLGAFFVERSVNKKKTMLGLSIVVTLSFLIFFKYTDFAILTYNDLSSLLQGETINLPHLMVPMGISFYSFVAVGYLVDVYKGKSSKESNFLDYALFVSYFPAILSGPIERSTTLLPQLKSLERTRYENAREGFILLLWGAFYKVVLADRLAICANSIFSDVHSYQGLSLLTASLAFTFQIYFDFAGYTYMALGISRFFNIKLNNNFNKPYLAVSLTDFWRRWHISLTSWFRDYLYIPLGGNRVSQGRWCFNILVVFLISGLWHGAYYTFIIWGGIHAVVQIVEKYVIRNKELRVGSHRGNNMMVRFARVVITFCIVSAAWVFFKAASVEDAIYMLKGMCIFSDYSFSQIFIFKGTYLLFGMSIIDTILSVFFVCFAIIFEIFVGSNNDGLSIPKWFLKQTMSVRWVIYVVLTLLILWFGKLGVSEFVYFNF